MTELSVLPHYSTVTANVGVPDGWAVPFWNLATILTDLEITLCWMVKGKGMAFFKILTAVLFVYFTHLFWWVLKYFFCVLSITWQCSCS